MQIHLHLHFNVLIVLPCLCVWGKQSETLLLSKLHASIVIVSLLLQSILHVLLDLNSKNTQITHTNMALSWMKTTTADTLLNTIFMVMKKKAPTLKKATLMFFNKIPCSNNICDNFRNLSLEVNNLILIHYFCKWT